MNKMNVTVAICPPCPVCKNQAEILVLTDDLDRWLAGEHAQNVWPDMLPEVREMLITGIHAECWDKL